MNTKIGKVCNHIKESNENLTKESKKISDIKSFRKTIKSKALKYVVGKISPSI